MTKRVIALVDANSFYASCEMAFNPSLWGRPVAVLSNNDGCVVAANQQAKALNAELLAVKNSLGSGGYQAARPDSMMFQPYFKVKWVLDKHRAAVFSSNYELYADMSNRMHTVLGGFARYQEIYSIDESFLDLTGAQQNLTEYGQEIKQRVWQWLHLPVSVGIGFTKVQAKLASHLSKRDEHLQGVLDLTSLDELVLNQIMATVSVGKVWGVGRKLEQRLLAEGINTALDLKNANVKTMRKKYSINVERVIRELRGEACLELNEVVSNKHQIVTSRSFGVLVTDYKEMEQAVVDYTLRAAEKMRKQNLVCKAVSVYITTHKHKQHHLQYRNELTLPLVYPSDHSVLLVKMTKKALKKIWREGYQYLKASVTLVGLSEKGPLQTDLFAPKPKFSGNKRGDELMKVVDGLNKVMGRHSIYIGSAGHQNRQAWRMRRNKVSRRYTTRWNELQVVKSG